MGLASEVNREEPCRRAERCLPHTFWLAVQRGDSSLPRFCRGTDLLYDCTKQHTCTNGSWFEQWCPSSTEMRQKTRVLPFGDKGESMTDQSWFVFALIGGVCFGLHAVLTRITLTDEFTPMVVNTYFFTLGTVILWLYTAFARNMPVPDSKTALKLLLMALVAVIGFWGVFKGYALAPNLGYVRAVFSVNVIVAYVLSLRLFDMALSTRGVMGMILVMVGTVLLSLG